MRTVALVPLAVLLASGAVVAVPAPAARAAAATATCSTRPSSWDAGTVDVCNGALTYHDYLYDDYGADTNAFYHSNRTSALCPSSGDQDYPDTTHDGSADIVHLTLQKEGDHLRVTAEMEALFDPHETLLAVAIDTDENAVTGGGLWPGLDVSSTGWDEMAQFTDGDTSTNTITGTMPLPTTSHWRVQAVAAVASTGQVMNVAYRGVDETSTFRLSTYGDAGDTEGSWFEDVQALALNKKDVSQFGYEVDAAQLAPTYTSPAAAHAAGLHERVYTSPATLLAGKGVNVAGVQGRGMSQRFQYIGKYQPYTVYVPKTYAPGTPTPMQMVFHGSNSNMTSIVNQVGFETAYSENLGRILVSPEMRGENGYGSDISERDILDVMTDAQQTYTVDPARVIASGYSEGGYVTYRMSMLYPDRFAGEVSIVGFTGDDTNNPGDATPPQGTVEGGAVGNMIDFTRNLREVPTEMLYAGADELVTTNSTEAMLESFQATDDVFTHYLHPSAEHLTLGILDVWNKDAAGSRTWVLHPTPGHVTYRTAPFLDDPSLGIVHDHAYWVSGISSSSTDPTAYEDVDLTSHGCPTSTTPVVAGTGMGTDPVPWTSRSDARGVGTPLAVGQRLEGTLSNVRALTVDSARACLDGSALTYSITTNGPATVTLSDGRSIVMTAAGLHQGVLAAVSTAAAGGNIRAGRTRPTAAAEALEGRTRCPSPSGCAGSPRTGRTRTTSPSSLSARG